MSHIKSVGAGIYSHLAMAMPLTRLTPTQLNALNTGGEFQALFRNEILSTVPGDKAAGTFVGINGVREYPGMGTPPNIIQVPGYGSKTSKQIQGQADAPSMELTLNAVPSDWAKGTILGNAVGDGEQYLFRFVMLNADPAGAFPTKFSNRGVSTVQNSQWYFIGKLEALVTTAQLTDANTATLTISVQSEIMGAFTSNFTNLEPELTTMKAYPMPSRAAIPFNITQNTLLTGWISPSEGILEAIALTFNESGTNPVRGFDGKYTIVPQDPGVRTMAYTVTDNNGGEVQTSITKPVFATLATDLTASGIDLGLHWTGSNALTAGMVHAAGVGNTDPVLGTDPVVIGTQYRVVFRIAYPVVDDAYDVEGSITIAVGGVTSAAKTATGTFLVTATATTTWNITPTADFNGTVLISISAEA